MRRGATALAIAIVLLCALAHAASAQEGVNVTVGDDVTFYPKADVDGWGNIGNVTYTISGQPYVLSGPTVATFLDSIGQPVVHVEEIRVARTSYPGDVIISHDRITGGYDGLDGHREALFSTERGPSVEFVRPMASDTDVNNTQDWVTAAVGGPDHKVLPLEVTVERYPGYRDLKLTGWASDVNPKAGTSVQFNVSVDGDPGNVSWRYHWNFDDDGSSSADRSPAHTYKAPGNWQPTVTVTDPSDGSSKTFAFTDPSIRVSGSSASPTPTPEATETATASPTPEANRSGGDGPTSGGGDGSQRDAATGSKRSTSKSSRATNGAKRGNVTPTPTATPAGTAGPTATATATVAASATAAPHGSGTGDAGGHAKTGEANSGTSKTTESSAPTPGATAAPETAPPEKAAPAARGVQVDGILLASSGSIADVIEAARSALPTKQDRSQARRGGGDSAPIAGWVGGGAGLFGLLLLGALREGGFRR